MRLHQVNQVPIIKTVCILWMHHVAVSGVMPPRRVRPQCTLHTCDHYIYTANFVLSAVASVGLAVAVAFLFNGEIALFVHILGREVDLPFCFDLIYFAFYAI